MNRRRWLVYSIVSTVGEELAIALAAIMVLPRLGLSFSWQVVAGVMVVVAGWGVIGYYIGVSIMGMRPILGKDAMVGKSGVVVRPLDPLGLVKIEGELWQGESRAELLDRGAEVIVLAQHELRLVVEKKKRVAA